MRHAASLSALVLPLWFVACGDSGTKPSATGVGGTANPTAPYTHGSDGTVPGAEGQGGEGGQGSSAPSTDDGFSPETPLGGFFRYGINGGFPNPNWNDADLAELESLRGCNSLRVSLPETHLERWGWGIELSDISTYASLGLTGHVGFLTSPTRPHSTAPASAADWELIHYLPKNLHEPILLDDGTINPENYWGAYVFQTVKTYKDSIKVWEIWNEPDWVSSWQVTEEWKTRAPVAADLPRFNGSIYDYVRMLRVSKIAAILADPEAKIATGGIGYATFLRAILNYTDNPVDGSKTAKYPATGEAYLDVISFHHYPIYTKGNSDEALDGYLSHVDDLAAEVAQSNAHIVGWQNTETGAPHAALGTFPGGDAYAVSYLLKVMTAAHSRGIDGIDWFVLSDSKAAGEADDPYQLMGLYLPVGTLASTSDAKSTNTGIAYATLSKFLSHATYDAAATLALNLPAQVRGAAFRSKSGTQTLVLWAKAVGVDETASASLPASEAFAQYEWDHSSSFAKTMVLAGEPLALSGTPRIFVRE